jgi:branched-subunit amino acid aminotransferase/4-amino-4-deoxychorismate lyase
MGLFETMLVMCGKVLHRDAHFARMAASAAALGFPPPPRDTFDAQITALTNADAIRCLYVQRDPGTWLLHANATAIPPLTLERRTHASAITLDLTRALPRHKLTSYAVCTIGLQRAAAAGANEGLFVTKQGLVLEGTATNLFAVRGTTLITASIDDGILPGVTRERVLTAAARLGFTLEERPPSPAEVREGAFLTGSLTGIVRLHVLDGVPCREPGAAFDELVRATGDA